MQRWNGERNPPLSSGPPASSGVTNSTPPDSTGPDSVYEAKIGEVVSIDCNGSPCFDVAVAKAASATHYHSSTYGDDTVDTKGDVFIAADVTFKATGTNTGTNSLDWQVYVDDTSAGDPVFPDSGPMPQLGSGDQSLPVGKSSKGWIIWEVPAKGKVVIQYTGGSQGPAAFEVTLRAK